MEIENIQAIAQLQLHPDNLNKKATLQKTEGSNREKLL